MSNYALELLQDHYDAVCEELHETWTSEEAEELIAKRDSLKDALIKLGGLQ